MACNNKLDNDYTNTRDSLWKRSRSLAREHLPSYKPFKSTEVAPLLQKPFPNDFEVIEKETYHAFVYTAFCPGLKKGDVEVEVSEDGRYLRIRTHKVSFWNKTDKEGNTKTVGSRSSFSQKFSLAPFLDINCMSAKLSDGVLTVTIPKLVFHRYYEDDSEEDEDDDEDAEESSESSYSD